MRKDLLVFGSPMIEQPEIDEVVASKTKTILLVHFVVLSKIFYSTLKTYEIRNDSSKRRDR
ncbi:MAG: hypothetical protein QME40_07105 [bacterium]|nr:hypothetical protein [bacterium]